MRTRFERPAIYLITRGEATPENYAESRSRILGIIRTAVECGVSMVQIREKRLPAKLLFRLVLDAAAMTCGSGTMLLVNDRADIATAAGADGVHLASQSLRANIIRPILGDEMMIGASVHSADEAKSAAVDGADFVVFGPVFSTPGKGKPVGILELARVCELLDPFPVIALGGIDSWNYQITLDSGSSGFAAIRYLNDADNLRRLSSELFRGRK